MIEDIHADDVRVTVTAGRDGVTVRLLSMDGPDGVAISGPPAAVGRLLMRVQHLVDKTEVASWILGVRDVTGGGAL